MAGIETKAGTGKVTRTDVARYAGVSTAVVSYVINGGPKPVAASTAKRVREAIKVLQYQPNATARALTMGSARLLGMIVPDSTNPYFAELTDAIAQAAAARGYAVLAANSRTDPETERQNTLNLVSRQVDAIIMATVLSPSEVAAMPVHGIPRVLIDQSSSVHGIPTISTDFEQGAVLGVQHLIGHDHRDIAILVGKDIDPARTDPRHNGWRKALREAGLREGPAEFTDFTRQGGYEATLRLLELQQRPTAIFASSDLLAVGALRAIHEAGLSIPDDIAVVSFDGTSESEFSWPQLTTVRQPINQIAERVIAAALSPASLGDHALLLATELVVRKSCGC
ncbi:MULTISPECIES: LacI family DNA-binding transcriptional regulator [Micrococcaceae]|uniref:LacI family transcriptional regulator n=1 Tax=Paenarthrobacter aromaticivorans TaxID=2849150 RepID=A0ABS6I2G1_9MICC|nr:MULTISPECIES: LacI family DNA-binding transcriptional regulator [Micrococcaceae]MBU8865931.1 LacI family transcriptional regulator [Paenarthrobacter sp. MMS21-TAE1-1]BCW06274.1 LacI family transcriptional regulator [Arthrobacter sp. NtRootA1]